MLPAACSHRLVAELQGALAACQRKEKELAQSIARCRVLLQPWEVPTPPSPEPARSTETNPAPEPTAKDLKELELLTQALDKALRVRKGISGVQSEEAASSRQAAPPLVPAQGGPGARPRTSNPKAHVPTKPLTTSQRASSRKKKPARTSSHEGRAPGDTLKHAKQPDNSAPSRGPTQPCPLPSDAQVSGLPTATPASALKEASSTAPSPGLQQEKIQPSLMSEVFTLKEKGTQLQLPLFYKKIASRNSSLWHQVQHSQSHADDDVAAAKAHFLERMKATDDVRPQLALNGAEGLHPSYNSIHQASYQKWFATISPAEIQEEVNRLNRACHLLTQHLEETLHMCGEAATDSLSLEQEYHCLVTLEGLQATVEQHLLRLQELREGETSWKATRGSVQELQTMTALQLRVAMLKQQIHLEEVLMEELLPLVKSESPIGPAQLALYRAIHSQLCEAGEQFSIMKNVEDLHETMKSEMSRTKKMLNTEKAILFEE